MVAQPLFETRINKDTLVLHILLISQNMFLHPVTTQFYSLISQLNFYVCMHFTSLFVSLSLTHKHTQTMKQMFHSELTDTCPVPNCRSMKSASCGCQAFSKWMPSSCYDSRSWPSCNCRKDAISSAHLVHTCLPVSAEKGQAQTARFCRLGFATHICNLPLCQGKQAAGSLKRCPSFLFFYYCFLLLPFVSHSCWQTAHLFRKWQQSLSTELNNSCWS